MTKIGDRYGRLVVVSPAETVNKHRRFVCACDCGSETTVRSDHLRGGKIKSCGCLWRQQTPCANGPQNMNYRHGRRSSPEYSSWAKMIQRCENPNTNRFQHYGGRGIRVCSRWRESFAAFIEDMGEKPSKKYSIDRIDVDGNYEPGNCRWALPSEQRMNRRDSVRP